MNDLHNLKIVLLIPDPFHDAWTNLISLCEDIKSAEDKMSSKSDWPILGLGIKSAHTTISIATLAAMRQWSDALILGRALFENEIILKWLLQEDTNNRIELYLSEILTEEKKLMRKIVESKSITAQIIRDKYSKENFLINNPENQDKRKNRKTVKDLAKQTAIERSYDIGYWIESMICHSHALSISQWNPELKKIGSPFIDFFGFKDKNMPCWMVLAALPMHSLDTFQLINNHFNLSLLQKIEGVRENFRSVVSKVSGGKWQFSSDIERGDMKVVFDNGETRHYRSNKTGIDPVDKLL